MPRRRPLVPDGSSWILPLRVPSSSAAYSFFSQVHITCIGDLYPASSNTSARLVSFRIVAISACSWPSQHSCFFKQFHPQLVIVNPRPGSRHVVRPSVVMTLVSSTRSSHTCDESKILTKQAARVCWSRNQSFPISSGVSCSRRRRGS